MHLLIIGAGAAGLMAAGAACEAGHTVTLLEHMPEPGKKLLITGKGRCNVTADVDERTFLTGIRSNPRFLYSSLYAFPPASAMELFERLGVPLKTERGNRVFPVSDRAQDVRAALLQWGREAQMVEDEAKELILEDGQCRGAICASGRRIEADAVLVCTGGVSYPVTGSTGIGYKLAEQAGHTIVKPQPSLVSLVSSDRETCRRMMGLSLRNVTLTLTEDGKSIFKELGEMLFTHFGISGPLTLSASSHLGDMRKHRYEAVIDLKPALDEKQLYDRITRDFTEFAGREAAHCLVKLLPASMQPVMLERWGMEPDRKVNQITREEKRKLVGLIKAFAVPLKERGDLEHAVITSGGVDVKQIDPKTMESRLCGNLYFAGEVLDVDGYTGGYNLQIAWCTAQAAVRALSR